jgi:hypothetical protein
MKKTEFIIEQHRDRIESEMHPYERKAWLINLFLDRMAETGYAIENVDQVATVLSTGAEKYIRTQIVNSTHMELAGGIRLSREAVFNSLEIPDLSEVQSVEKIMKEYHTIPLSSLTFQDGRFSVSAETKERVIRMHTEYALNDRHIAMYNSAKKVAKSVNDFAKEFGPPKGGVPIAWHHLGSPGDYLEWDPKAWVWSVNTNRLKWVIESSE